MRALAIAPTLALTLSVGFAACRQDPIARTRPAEPVPSPAAPSPAPSLPRSSSPSSDTAGAHAEGDELAGDAATTGDGGAFDDCGSEKNVHGEGYRADARECLWRAYESGRRARFSITLHTVEGDPIRYDIAVQSRSDVTVTIDNRDRFGASGKSVHACRTLSKEPRQAGRFVFTLTGCKGGGPSVISVR